MSAYYNENDPKAAAWLRELIKVGAVAPGTVDERSIEDVTPNDLRDFTQHHFFAGIGGWSYALRLAGWPDERPVWTGSCPCQPFSSAGAGRGFDDKRHLWPNWFWLISQCRPSVIFGEQVANALPWLDLVQSDLEAEELAFWAAIIGAHSVGAPHIRQRIYWVAESQGQQPHGRWDSRRRRRQLADGRVLDNAPSARRNGAIEDSEGEARDETWLRLSGSPVGSGDLGDSDEERQQQHAQFDREPIAGTISPPRWTDASGSSFVDCRDGKRRPVEPGTFPLAHGVSGRVGLLRGYGNAIVPADGAAFIGAYLAA